MRRAMIVTPLFPTLLYRARLDDSALNADLARSVRSLARDDGAGRAWSKQHGYRGYTSYASLNDLPKRDPAFAALKKAIDPHAAAFGDALAFDLGRRKLRLDSMWANVLEPGGAHSAHLHPGSVLSGAYYVAMPRGASAIKFEDPRLMLMMAAPAKREDAPESAATFVTIAPAAGDLLLWESFVRHEVPANGAKQARLSVSFNYAW